MNLNYDFPPEVRNLFIDYHTCYECGQNGSGRGGLQIHHIWGRVSSSALNASLLCQKCHERVTGSLEEKIRYFTSTCRLIRSLGSIGAFTWSETDTSFVHLVYPDIGEKLSTLLLEQ